MLAGILFFGMVLRFHNHATWPREGATFDEYAWTWLGVNLIKTGIPVSWSPHPQYEKRTHYVAPAGARFWLVEPYLEHPPLFGLVAGGYAVFRGARDMYDVSFGVIREFALLLGASAIVMVYVFASRIYGVNVGLLSALLYAISPTVVIGSRIMQNENFFISLFLGILVFVHKYLHEGKRLFLYSAAILAGLAMLAKVPWFAATVSATGILLSAKKWRDAILFPVIVGVLFSLYIFYGMLWDRELFFSLWSLQLNRYDMAFDSIFALMLQPYLVDRYFVDGWIYAGWFAWLILLVGKVKKHTYLIFGLLGYFLIYIAAIPNEPSHGWYRYPFYPFLLVSLAVFIKEYRNKFLAVSLVYLGIALSLFSHTWAAVFGFSYAVYRALIVWFGLGILPECFPTKRIAAFAAGNNFVQFIVLILLSVWTVLRYNEQ